MARRLWIIVAAIGAVACHSPRSAKDPAASMAPVQVLRVTVPGPAGRPLAANVYGVADHVIVILAHGGYSSLESWAPQSEQLAAAGFRVLVVEAGAAAELAAGRETPCLYEEKCLAEDVLAAVRYARSDGARRVSLMGGSMGGAAVAQASIEAPVGHIESLVLLAPAGIATPERVQGRKLFVATRDDANNAGPRLPGIRAQYERIAEPKRFVLLDGAAHAQRVFGTPQGDSLLRQIIEFLRGEAKSR